MKQERIYIIALFVLAILAVIPQIPVDAQIWGALLAIVGLVAGVLVNPPDLTQRALIYIVAIGLSMFDDSLTAIWVVGTWLDAILDNVAIGIQGMAVGLFLMAMLARVQGTQPGTS